MTSHPLYPSSAVQKSCLAQHLTTCGQIWIRFRHSYLYFPSRSKKCKPSYSTLLRKLMCYQELRFDIATLSLVECPPPGDWKLFDMYAYRVRRTRPREAYLDRALYQWFVSVRTAVERFPRLSSLWCCLLGPFTPGMKVFPSSLRSLSIFHLHWVVVLKLPCVRLLVTHLF